MFKPRYVLKANMVVLEIKASDSKADIEVNIAYVPKGVRNWTPMVSQYSVQYHYYGLGHCTKSFCMAKKWRYLRPLNSDGTRNIISVHWANHFKELCDTKKLIHGKFKMADNHLRILFSQHILKRRGHNFTNFDYHEKNSGLYRIKIIDSTRKK